MLQVADIGPNAPQMMHRDTASGLSKPLEACFQRLFGILSVYPRGTQAGSVEMPSLPAALNEDVRPETSTSLAQNLQRELVATTDQLYAAQRWTAAVEASCKTQMLAATQRAEAAEEQMHHFAAIAQAASERTRKLGAELQIAEERAERCEAEMQSLRTMLLEAERQLNANKGNRLVDYQSECRVRTYHTKGTPPTNSMASFKRLVGWR